MSTAPLPSAPEVLEPTRKQVELLIAEAPARPQLLGAAQDVLAPDESAAVRRFRHPAQASSYATGRILRRVALSPLVGVAPEELVFDSWCPRCGTAHGKPRLLPPHGDIDFSVSRAGAVVALAIGRVHVGLDVASSSGVPDAGVVRLAFAPDERREYAALPEEEQSRAFFACWTRKEAVLKGIGHGLAVDPSSVSVTLLELSPPRVRRLPAEFGPAHAWSLVPVVGEGWVGAVAAEGPVDVRAWDARALFERA